MLTRYIVCLFTLTLTSRKPRKTGAHDQLPSLPSKVVLKYNLIHFMAPPNLLKLFIIYSKSLHCSVRPSKIIVNFNINQFTAPRDFRKLSLILLQITLHFHGTIEKQLKIYRKPIYGSRGTFQKYLIFTISHITAPRDLRKLTYHLPHADLRLHVTFQNYLNRGPDVWMLSK